MKKHDWIQLGIYSLAATLAVGGAFLISLRFTTRARAISHGSSFRIADNSAGGMSGPGDLPAASSQDGAQGGRTENMSPGQSPPSQTQSQAQSQAQIQATNTGIAELEGFLEPFLYDVSNRRDPFQPFAEFFTPEDATPTRALSPAQRYELEQLKLIGIMWDVRDPKAMFLDPKEEVMILGRDESIGNHNGYIAAIREGEVVVVEAIHKRGDVIYRTRVLRIER